jgi:hypothetical protein
MGRGIEGADANQQPLPSYNAALEIAKYSCGPSTRRPPCPIYKPA